MRNERGAGRKPALTAQEIVQIRKQLEQGRTMTELAKEYHVSRQTLFKYLNPKEDTDDTIKRIYRTANQWMRLNRCFGAEDVTDYTIRMDFMDGDECCTCLLVDCMRKRILIRNTTDELIHRAFGIKSKPSWEDFEAFLEDRCFPRTRGHLKLVLEDVGVDSYDPLAIVEKTGGRMAEDNQWLKIMHYVPVEGFGGKHA